MPSKRMALQSILSDSSRAPEISRQDHLLTVNSSEVSAKCEESEVDLEIDCSEHFRVMLRHGRNG